EIWKRGAVVNRYFDEYRNQDGTAGISPRTCGRDGRGPKLSRIASIGAKAGTLDAVHGAGLVLVRSVAADPDRADDLARGVADQHAAGHRHDAAARGRHQRLQEYRVGAGAAGEFAAAKAHPKSAPGLAHRDLGPQQAGAVL